jgi:VanZ family protein
LLRQLERVTSNRPSAMPISFFTHRAAVFCKLISNRTAAPALQILARIIAWGLATGITVLSVVPPSLRPETALPHGLEHFAIYWAAGLAFALGYNLAPAPLITLLVIFSGAIEIVQIFVPGRHARLSDFIVDALASIIGVITVYLIDQIRGRARI